MTPEYIFLLMQPFLFLTGVFIACRWSPARRNREKVAAQLLEANPGAELLDEVLALQSNWRDGKQGEIDRRIREMQDLGWTYLKTSEVWPWISLRSWGGAMRLHFLRKTLTVGNEEHQ